MKTLAAALLALTLFAPVAIAAEAEAKPCKAGKVLNPDTGKCVTPRGS